MLRPTSDPLSPMARLVIRAALAVPAPLLAHAEFLHQILRHTHRKNPKQ